MSTLSYDPFLEEQQALRPTAAESLRAMVTPRVSPDKPTQPTGPLTATLQGGQQVEATGQQISGRDPAYLEQLRAAGLSPETAPRKGPVLRPDVVEQFKQRLQPQVAAPVENPAVDRLRTALGVALPGVDADALAQGLSDPTTQKATQALVDSLLAREENRVQVGGKKDIVGLTEAGKGERQEKDIAHKTSEGRLGRESKGAIATAANSLRKIIADITIAGREKVAEIGATSRETVATKKVTADTAKRMDVKAEKAHERSTKAAKTRLDLAVKALERIPADFPGTESDSDTPEQIHAKGNERRMAREAIKVALKAYEDVLLTGPEKPSATLDEPIPMPVAPEGPVKGQVYTSPDGKLGRWNGTRYMPV